tara:strand:- start:269 stop:436 length:168 start_codon:yes stop_codon:yes gene_type:complete
MRPHAQNYKTKEIGEKKLLELVTYAIVSEFCPGRKREKGTRHWGGTSKMQTILCK